MTTKTTWTLTDLDLQVLAQMEQDPTISNQALANALGITRAQIIARLNRIEGLDIAHVVALTDMFAGGARMVYLYVRSAGRPVAELAEEISDLPYIMTVTGLVGPDDLLATMRLPPGRDTADALNLLVGVQGIASVRTALILQAYLGRSERMHFSRRKNGSVEDRKASLMADLTNVEMDDLDYALLAEFQTDGRVRVRDLAHRYGLTQGAIRYRLRNLHSKKLLRLVLTVDPLALGLQVWTSFEIVIAPDRLDVTAERICAQPRAVMVARTTGSASLLCLLLTPDIEEMRDVLYWARQLDGVRSVEPQIVSGIYKNEAVWGILPD